MKRCFMRGLLMVLLSVCLLATLLPGCSGVENPEKPETTSTAAPSEELITLRVLIEEADSSVNYMSSYVARRKQSFMLKHENVQILVEKLPKEEGREEVLQRLRVELMMGQGPDILLLPTQPTDNADYSGYLEPLFPDVQMAMRNGLFLDLSAYYDADTELNREALNSRIMDAGVYNGSRYVLPLSYNMPVVFVAKEAFAQSGLPEDIFTYNAIDLLNAVAQMEDLDAAGSFYQMYSYGEPLTFNFFPQLIDYDTGEVAVTQETLVAYMQAWENYRRKTIEVVKSGKSLSIMYDLSLYYGPMAQILNHAYWADDGLFASFDSMTLASDNVLQARTSGVELDAYPLRAIDGSVVADVTTYTAVSSGCKHPELAYEFLRGFLEEEFQWQTDKHTGLDFYGWPVRTEGSLAPMCAITQNFGSGSEEVNGENIRDEELPILNAQIDHVRFGISLEVVFGDYIIACYNSRDGKFVVRDLDQFAAECIEELQRHADES